MAYTVLTLVETCNSSHSWNAGGPKFPIPSSIPSSGFTVGTTTVLRTLIVPPEDTVDDGGVQ